MDFEAQLRALDEQERRKAELEALRGSSFAFDPKASPMRPNEERAGIYSAARGGGYSPEVSNIFADHGVIRQGQEMQEPMPDGSAGYRERGIVAAPAAAKAVPTAAVRTLDITADRQNRAMFRDAMNNATGGIEAAVNRYRMQDGMQQGNMARLNKEANQVGVTREGAYRARNYLDSRADNEVMQQFQADRNLMPERIAGLQDAGATLRTGMQEGAETFRQSRDLALRGRLVDNQGFRIDEAGNSVFVGPNGTHTGIAQPPQEIPNPNMGTPVTDPTTGQVLGHNVGGKYYPLPRGGGKSDTDVLAERLRNAGGTEFAPGPAEAAKGGGGWGRRMSYAVPGMGTLKMIKDGFAWFSEKGKDGKEVENKVPVLSREEAAASLKPGDKFIDRADGKPYRYNPKK